MPPASRFRRPRRARVETDPRSCGTRLPCICGAPSGTYLPPRSVRTRARASLRPNPLRGSNHAGTAVSPMKIGAAPCVFPQHTTPHRCPMGSTPARAEPERSWWRVKPIRGPMRGPTTPSAAVVSTAGSRSRQICRVGSTHFHRSRSPPHRSTELRPPPIHRHHLRVWGVHLMAKHQTDGDTHLSQMLERGRSGVPRSAQAPGHPMGAETLRLLTRGSPAGLQMGVLPVRDESHAAARPRVAFCVARAADARSRAAVPVQPSIAATCIPCGIAGSAASIMVATGYAHASTAKAPAGR